MGDFFGSIYCWLEDFFGVDLANYLWGEAALEQHSNMFIGIGLWMLGISLAMAVLYYYIIDHPRLSNWWGWTIFLGINAVINFLVAWQWVLRDFYDGLMVYKDTATGNVKDLPIGTGDIMAFGATNMIDSVIVFFIFSMIIKWRSRSCSHAPF